jgi:hypothetical protein
MSKKVFISSAIYDLIDIRAELAELLRGIGLKPVMSDVANSDFALLPNANSIETCLANVEACDFFICILSQRYGPRLGALGFENLSATHLEYRRARISGKPILFYVRDRLESEFAIWKRNRAGETHFSWVKSPDDYGLFELLEEHRILVAEANQSNWFAVFQDSTDLKDAVSAHLRIPKAEVALQAAIEDNRIPIIDCQAEMTRQWWGDPWEVNFDLTWINVGTVPGFNVELLDLKLDGTASRIRMLPVFGPGQKTQIFPILSKQTGDELGETRTFRFGIKIQLPSGTEIHDVFSFFAKVDYAHQAITHSVDHVSRKYVIPKSIELPFRIVQSC